MSIKRVYVRFYEELNDFLSKAQRYSTIEHSFHVSSSVKDMIEGLGIPHPEVDLIIVNGESVDFTYRIADGDRISVYPMFESLDISPAMKVRSKPLRETRFSVDANLGRLARYLRLLGFDTRYDPGMPDAELATGSQSEGRVLLTRDVGLLKRRTITHGYYVRASDPKVQVVEVLTRFELARATRPFSRCTLCNGDLVPVDKKDVADRVPAGSLRRFEDFRSCSGCGRVYWEGSHMERASDFIDEVLRASGS